MSFTKKRIDVAFQLNDGTKFAGTSSSIVTLSGLKVSATIVKSGGAGMTETQLRIYGMTSSQMAQLGTYGAPPDLASNATVQVSAGDDDGSSLQVIAVGTVQRAAPDYNQMPEVGFVVSAFTGLVDAIRVATSTSVKGSADAAQLMAGLAKTMGYAFENNGVAVQFSNPHFWGSARSQAAEIAVAGNFNWIIDGETLAIWPKNGSRTGQPVLVSPDTGMVSYPTFLTGGVLVKALFNPTLKYGTQIQVQSSLKQACGIWVVTNLAYELESETPNGAWFNTIEAYSPKFAEIVSRS